MASLNAKLISEGIGSTWWTLAQRGLLEVEEQLPPDYGVLRGDSSRGPAYLNLPTGRPACRRS
ncbi:MAG: hypothetical protein ACRYG7_54750 [Janthinobacterium lividum]